MGGDQGELHGPLAKEKIGVMMGGQLELPRKAVHGCTVRHNLTFENLCV